MKHSEPTGTIVLTIAGSDTSAGAGAQLDLRVFQACGVYGVSALTALTAQNSAGVHRVHRVPPRFVADQIDALARDLSIAAAKTGMLDRARTVEVVAERIQRRRIPNLVVDPVLLAKDGTPLLNTRGLEAVKKQLFPLARVVTPNVPEAEVLSSVRITDAASAREAAARIAQLGPEAVVIKGGHLPGEPIDTLYLAGEFHEFPSARLAGTPVHGTGCCYSAALAARLALGDELPEACRFAQALVRRAIAEAQPLGKGSRLITSFR